MNPLVLLLVVALAAAGWWGWRRHRQLRETEAAKARELDALRRQHAAALREEQERFAALLGQMLEGLIVVDDAGRITLANRAAAQLFGIQPPYAGRPLLEVVRHHDFAALLTRLEHEPEVPGHELQLEGPAVRTLSVSAVRLRDENLQPAGALFVMRDLTTQRKLEGMREEFVANVSHELRTPLSLIKGAAETLLDGGKEDPETLAKFLGIIDRHASRLALLIEDLLLLSALDSGRIELHVQATALHATVQEVLDDFAPAAKEKGAALANEVPATLRVRADVGRLRQVLSNLVDNAIKYGRENGRVQVGAAVLGAGWLQIFVRDDGPGITAAARERVFERFFRVDKARARTQGGTGLGLAIVKNLVLAHGGEVRVESAEGRGTTFFFKLPSA